MTNWGGLGGGVSSPADNAIPVKPSLGSWIELLLSDAKESIFLIYIYFFKFSNSNNLRPKSLSVSFFIFYSQIRIICGQNLSLSLGQNLSLSTPRSGKASRPNSAMFVATGDPAATDNSIVAISAVAPTGGGRRYPWSSIVGSWQRQSYPVSLTEARYAGSQWFSGGSRY